MDKNDLRLQLKTSREKLSAGEIDAKSQAVTNKLKNLVNWSEITTLHSYLPLENQNEVDTHKLFEFLWGEHPHIICYTNRLQGGKWQDVKVEPGFLLTKINQLPKLNSIIVPMLGFDENLHRLGYGKGYYDRFLASQPQAQKIGLSFELGKVDKLPTEPHDVQLDLIITEDQVYKSLSRI